MPYIVSNLNELPCGEACRCLSPHDFALRVAFLQNRSMDSGLSLSKSFTSAEIYGLLGALIIVSSGFSNQNSVLLPSSLKTSPVQRTDLSKWFFLAGFMRPSCNIAPMISTGVRTSDTGARRPQPRSDFASTLLEHDPCPVEVVCVISERSCHHL